MANNENDTTNNSADYIKTVIKGKDYYIPTKVYDAFSLTPQNPSLEPVDLAKIPKEVLEKYTATEFFKKETFTQSVLSREFLEEDLSDLEGSFTKTSSHDDIVNSSSGIDENLLNILEPNKVYATTQAGASRTKDDPSISFRHTTLDDISIPATKVDVEPPLQNAQDFDLVSAREYEYSKSEAQTQKYDHVLEPWDPLQQPKHNWNGDKAVAIQSVQERYEELQAETASYDLNEEGNLQFEPETNEGLEF